MSLTTVTSDWRPPGYDFPTVNDVGAVCAIDVETRDPQLKKLGPGGYRDGYLIGVSLSYWKGARNASAIVSKYYPFAHGENKRDPSNMDPARVLDWLRDFAAGYRGEVVGANLSYDLEYLLAAGVTFGKAKLRDVQIAEPLIWELSFSYSLQNIAKKYGYSGKDESLMYQAAADRGIAAKDVKGAMWQLPPEFVGPYAEADTALPLQIYEAQRKKLTRENLWPIFELESDVLPVLVKMKSKGVRIDFDKLAQIEARVAAEEMVAYSTVKHLTGTSIDENDIWRAAALVPIIEARGIKLPLTEKGTPSLTAQVLENSDDEVARAIVQARKKNKIRTTFVRSITDHAIGDRVKAGFVQIAQEQAEGGTRGVRYGRMSCRSPNLQQQPTRDPSAHDWREIFLPEPGEEWASCDYSQQEPRWTTHFAARIGAEGAAAAEAEYITNPNVDNHQFMSDLTGVDRKFAKGIFLGLCYGEGGAKMSRSLGLPTGWSFWFDGERYGPFESFADLEDETAAMGIKTQELDPDDELPDGIHGHWLSAGKEGQAIIDKFNERAPYVRQLAKKAQQRAKDRQYITTVGGRKLHFRRMLKPRGWETIETHKALNRLIQGSAADQMKAALVDMDREGLDVRLQVHDEVCLTIKHRNEAERAAEIMKAAHTRFADNVNIPFKVDVEIGPNWGKAK